MFVRLIIVIDLLQSLFSSYHLYMNFLYILNPPGMYTRLRLLSRPTPDVFDRLSLSLNLFVVFNTWFDWSYSMLLYTCLSQVIPHQDVFIISLQFSVIHPFEPAGRTQVQCVWVPRPSTCSHTLFTCSNQILQSHGVAVLSSSLISHPARPSHSAVTQHTCPSVFQTNIKQHFNCSVSTGFSQHLITTPLRMFVSIFIRN